MANSRMFFGGLPTGPDVEKLIGAFGVPQPGVLEYAQLEAALGVPFRTTRFRVVTNAWRKRLAKEHNVSTEAVAGVGIKVLAEVERIGKATRGFRTGTRRIRGAVIEGRSIRAEQLAPADRLRCDHFNRVAMMVYDAATQAVKEIAPPRSLPQLPRSA